MTETLVFSSFRNDTLFIAADQFILTVTHRSRNSIGSSAAVGNPLKSIEIKILSGVFVSIVSRETLFPCLTEIRQWRILHHGDHRDPEFYETYSDILVDDEYKELQHYLVKHPDTGEIIQGSGGLRKLRWSASGRGKSGGARVIYYWVVSKDTLLMLFAFKKNERSDISKDQIKKLREIVKKEYP